MEHGEGDLKIFTLQVGVEFGDVMRHHQPFVGNHRSGKTGDVAGRVVRQPFFDLLAGQVDQGVKAAGRDQGRRDDKDLNDFRQHRQGIFAKGIRIQRDLTHQKYAQIILFTLLAENIQLQLFLAEENGRHGKLFRQRQAISFGRLAHEINRH